MPPDVAVSERKEYGDEEATLPKIRSESCVCPHCPIYYAFSCATMRCCVALQPFPTMFRAVGKAKPLRKRVPRWLASAEHCRKCFAVSSRVVEQCPSGRIETGKPQLTLARTITRAGVGLHSGEVAELRVSPAAAGDGRYFVVGNCKDRENNRIPAMIEYVRETALSTCLGLGEGSVRTVEHLMSALEGLGVDNCRIEIRDGNEVPLLDGSALEWVEAIKDAGLSVAEDEIGSSRSRRAIILKEPVSVWHEDSFVAGFPASRTRLTYGIDFAQVQAIGSQWFTWSPDDSSAYGREIAPARTFGIFEQINHLQAAGFIKGGSLKNALVCSVDKGWLNPPLRFDDEPCRHKLLDLIGDLALCAYRGDPGLPLAHIIAYKASHSLHVKFGAAILSRTASEIGR